MKFETVREATEFWVREFSAVSTGMIKDLMYMHPEDWCEVTFTTVNDRICYYGDPTDFDGSSRHGEIISDGEEKD